jgi:hypothetical protein
VRRQPARRGRIRLHVHLPAIYAYTDTQTNAHSETPYDTEAAPESAAKARLVIWRAYPAVRMIG